MRAEIIIPSKVYRDMTDHLFQNDLEQAAFLFAEEQITATGTILNVVDAHLVPPGSWEIQESVYLQMKDEARSKIMTAAGKHKLCAIDCHSHPHSDDDVWFSLSDIAGITEFARYAHWKLENRPFAAIVFGERSLDAILWRADQPAPDEVEIVRVTGNSHLLLTPTKSWFSIPRGYNRFMTNE